MPTVGELEEWHICVKALLKSVVDLRHCSKAMLWGDYDLAAHAHAKQVYPADVDQPSVATRCTGPRKWHVSFTPVVPSTEGE